MRMIGKCMRWLRHRAETASADAMLLELVRHFESFSPTWYICPGGVRTIGYGYTGALDGKQQPPWTREYAEIILRESLAGEYADRARAACYKAGIDLDVLEPHKRATVISICFNAGPGAIWMRDGKPATWARLLRDGAGRQQICSAYYQWCKAGGKTQPGLVRRRFAEMRLFWDRELDLEPDGWRSYYIQHS